MNELFSLVGEYQDMYDKLTDPEMDEESVKGMLEVISADISEKAAGIAVIRDRLKMELAACEAHEKEWQQRKQVRKNNIERLNNMIVSAMIAMNKTDLEAGDVKFHIQNAGGQTPIVFDETKTVPERFTKLTIENDNAKIREALENGEELDFAHFGERSKILRVK